MQKHPFLLILFLCFSSSIINAAHIIGGQVSYRCLGNSNYEVTIKMYRDCFGGGANFDSTPFNIVGQVTIYQGNQTIPFQSIDLDEPAIVAIEPELDFQCIANAPNICVEEGTYVFTTNLPPSSDSYHITYQRCCRNNTISNIQDPGTTGATYTVEILSQAQLSCNNSPVFNDFPPIVICGNKPFFFDHSATDSEGDSLVYGFCAPLKGGDIDSVAPNPDSPPNYKAVKFVTPTYSAEAPLAGDPVVSIDPVTGMITGTPLNMGQFVVGICVREYRNGQLLSTIQRDFQFNVTPCDYTIVAALDGASSDGKNYTYELCLGDPLMMLNESYNTDDINDYQWQINMEDNNPIFSSATDFFMETEYVGTFDGWMALNPGTVCTDTAFIQILIHSLPSAEIQFDYDTCIAGPVSFLTTVPLHEHPIISWNWDFGDGNFSTDTIPIHRYDSLGMYDVSVHLLNDQGCRASEYLDLNWHPDPIITLDIPTFAGCNPLTIDIDSLGSDFPGVYALNWNLGDGTTGTSSTIQHSYDSVGIYDINISATSPAGCITDFDFPERVTVDPYPVAAFQVEPVEIFKFENILFEDLSEEAVQWVWAFSEGDTSMHQSPIRSFREGGPLNVQLTVEDQYGCVDSTSQLLEVLPVYHIFVPNAFSPNQDGNNDEFRAFASCPLDDFNMKVFDRWGQLIFQSTDVEIAWDGHRRNELYDSGVFTWWISYVVDEQERVLSGDVTLLR